MKIPEARLRDGFYSELTTRCLLSRDSRRSEYERLRAYYLFGADALSQQAIYNKIQPSIDTLTSFLFAVDTTRFIVKLGTSVKDIKAELEKVGPLVQRHNERWQDSNADIILSMAVEWALVYNTMLVKLVQRGKETHPYLLQPHCFGVFDESETMLDRQEAFVHTYTTTKPQLRRELADHPRAAEILQRLSVTQAQQGDMPAGVQRVIINSQNPLSGSYTGNVNDVLGGAEQYRPVTQEELIELKELWVWNDAAHDYQVATMADPDICLYDRTAGDGKMFIRGEHPFTQVCPNPAPDYFWGYSEVNKLTKLQDRREHHLVQIDTLVDRNVNPPKALTGMWGDVDEKQSALQRLGAIIGSQDPTAKVQEFKPQIPNDLWQIVDKIDMMFDETISLNNLSKGHGDTGVRSKGQTDALLRVGSSRPKKRALTIEDSIERIATLYFKLDQQHNPEPLYTEQQTEFIAEQFTKDYSVKVDAHSSSPIFVEDQKQMAFELFNAKVIDGEELLEMLQPQNLQRLKQKYKEMAAKQAQQQQAEQQQEQAKDGGGKRLQAVSG